MKINQRVFLIGTNHKYQHNSSFYEEVSAEAIDEFKKYISAICYEKIEAIGEEFHRSDLMQDRDKSVPKEIALELGVSHKYCSPSDEELVALGWKDHILKMPEQSEDEFSKHDWENDKIPEKEWIKNILALNKWPMLFIC